MLANTVIKAFLSLIENTATPTSVTEYYANVIEKEVVRHECPNPQALPIEGLFKIGIFLVTNLIPRLIPHPVIVQNRS